MQVREKTKIRNHGWLRYCQMTFETPFAILLTNELQQAQPNRQALLLPLTLTYLLSEHIQVLLPVPEANSRLVDAIFDDVIRGLTLKSQGIAYLKDFPEADIAVAIKTASLVLTLDDSCEQIAKEHETPYIYLRQMEKGETIVRSGCLAKIVPEELQVQAVGFVQLIHVLSKGVLSKGHFSLSW